MGECSLGIADWRILWLLCGIIWPYFDDLYCTLEVNFFFKIHLLLYTILFQHILQSLMKTLDNYQQKLQLEYFLASFVTFFIRHRKSGIYPCKLNSRFSGNSSEFSKIPSCANKLWFEKLKITGISRRGRMKREESSPILWHLEIGRNSQLYKQPTV